MGRRKRKKKIIRREEEMHEEGEISIAFSLMASAITATNSFLRENDILLQPSQTLALESSITEAAKLLSYLHSLLSVSCYTQPSSQTNLALTTYCPSPSYWFSRFVSASSIESDLQWIQNFRMSKTSFNLLLRTLSSSLQSSNSVVIPPDHKLAAALFRLAHAAPFKSVGRRFGFDSSIACRCFYEVCKAVHEQLDHLFEFPSSLKRIIEGFGWISLPNCCGALGFSRFMIDRCTEKDSSTITQVLVDTELRFLHVSSGWPDSMSPDAILSSTKMFSEGTQVGIIKLIENNPSFQLLDGNVILPYIVGDSCCPLFPWLLTPYSKDGSDGFKEEEIQFNLFHSRGMDLVTKALTMLRNRWHLLSISWKEEEVGLLPYVIITGCLLHNFLIKCSEHEFDDLNENLAEGEKFSCYSGMKFEDGAKVRDALALHLNQVSHMK